MNRKLLYTIVLAALLLVGISVQAQGGTVTPAGEFPIVTEPTTLKILMVDEGGTLDYNDNAYTTWLEEKTGLDLQIEVVAQSDAQTKLSLALASGDLPDVIAGFSPSSSLIAQMGAQGVFLPLNDLMSQYGVETKRVFEVERPQLLPQIISPDGNIYGLPDISECFHCFMSQKMWVYKPWLDKLGLAVPTTTDEFEAMLKAFKDQDPNGNGIADEVPFSGNAEGAGGWHNSIDQFLMNSFVFYDRIQQDRLLLLDGKVEAAYAQPGYREGLRYLHNLYAEGLIDPNALIQDNNALLQLGSQMEPHLLGAVTGGWMGSYTLPQTIEQGGEMENWVAVPPLKGPDGVQTTAYAPWGYTPGRWIVTNKAQNPAAAFRLGDLMYSADSTMRNSWGIEGTDWFTPPEGELSIDGHQAAYRINPNWRDTQSTTSWEASAINYRTSEWRLSQSATDQYVEVALYAASHDMLPYAPAIDALIPPLNFSAEVAPELTEAQLAVKTYVDEMATRFITGDADIDAEWDTYLATLNSQGLPRLLEITQQAYDELEANAG